MPYYFAYGSNMDVDDFNKWCRCREKPSPEWKLIEVAWLENYELAFNYYSRSRRGGAANLMEKAGSSVYGLLFKVSDDELGIIAEKEGHPSYYEEVEVEVRSGKGTPTKAKSYKVIKEREEDQHQLPTEEYMQLIIRNGRKHGFPAAYLSFLESIAVKS